MDGERRKGWMQRLTKRQRETGETRFNLQHHVHLLSSPPFPPSSLSYLCLCPHFMDSRGFETFSTQVYSPFTSGAQRVLKVCHCSLYVSTWHTSDPLWAQNQDTLVLTGKRSALISWQKWSGRWWVERHLSWFCCINWLQGEPLLPYTTLKYLNP